MQLYFKFFLDIRASVSEFESRILHSMIARNVPKESILNLTKLGRQNLFFIMQNALPKIYRDRFQGWRKTQINSVSNEDMVKDPDYELCLEQIRLYVQSWFMLFTRDDIAEGTLMNPSTYDVSNIKKRQHENSGNKTNKRFKRDNRNFIASANNGNWAREQNQKRKGFSCQIGPLKRAKKKFNGKCFKCQKNHMIKYCPEFSNDKERNEFMLARRSQIKAQPGM